MGNVFGIADLPVAKPFPSLDFSINNVEKPLDRKPIVNKPDIFVKKAVPNKRFLKQLFSRVKH